MIEHVDEHRRCAEHMRAAFTRDGSQSRLRTVCEIRRDDRRVMRDIVRTPPTIAKA